MPKRVTRARQSRPRRLSGAERRASIVAAAAAVFSEVGYQRGTMSEVARRVGVTEPVVFQNFGTKPAVFAAVLDDATERATAAMRAGVAACGSVGAWLTEFLGPEHLGRDHARGAHAVLFAEAMSHATEPAVKDAIRRTHRTVARTLVDLLARGQREGSVRPGLDPRVCAWWLLSFLASQGFRAAAMPDRSRLEPQLGAMTLQMLTTAER